MVVFTVLIGVTDCCFFIHRLVQNILASNTLPIVLKGPARVLFHPGIGVLTAAIFKKTLIRPLGF